MKVLKVIHTRGHGGAENVFRWLALGLKKEGVDVLAAIPEVEDPAMENWITPALEDLDIPYVTFNREGSPLDLLHSLTGVIRRTRPDLVHSHLLDSNFYTCLACRRLAVPHVCTEHGDVKIKRGFGTRLKYGTLFAWSSAVVGVSDEVSRRLCRFRGSGRKVRTIPNGIRCLERQQSAFRRENGISGRTLLVGNVGNLYPVKGQRFLIEAFARFRRIYPDSTLVLVGRGGEEAALREQVGRLGIPAGRVLLTGFRKDVPAILNALDLYVQPSLSEGHPVAVLEAMSLGLPVVATAVGGVPEMVAEVGCGSLVSPGSADELFEALCSFAQTPWEYRARAAAGAARVKENFSIERMSRSYIALYERTTRERTDH